MRRIVSLCLVLLILVGMLTAFTSCASPVYMTIGTEEVRYDLVKSFVHSHLAAYSEEELKDEALRDEIRERVLNDLKMAFVIPNVAKELGVRLTSDKKDAIEEELDYYQSMGDLYDELLAAQFATEEVFETLLTINAYDDLVFDAITEGAALGTDRFSGSNEVVDADLAKGDWYACEYIVLCYDDVNREIRKKELEEVRAAIASGISFSDASKTLKKLYVSEFTYGIEGCFTSTIMLEETENTVKALGIGEISEIKESYTADGSACYLLVRRNAISDEYVDAHYNDVVAYYLTREYTLYMKERAEALTVTVLEKYKDLDILDIE